MYKWKFIIVFALFPLMASMVTQAVPIDINGDGVVGPEEALDLSNNWKGPALQGGGQPWQINGSNIYYSLGNVGIGVGVTNPLYPLTINAGGGDFGVGFGWVQVSGDQQIGAGLGPLGGYLGTLSDHPLHLFTNITTPRLTITRSGNVGIGTTNPNARTQLNVFTNESGNQAIRGDSPNGNGVVGTNNTTFHSATAGVNSGADGIGVYGEANNGLGGRGVWGHAAKGAGVYGSSDSGDGGLSAGVYGTNSAGNGVGVLGVANSAPISGNSPIGVSGRSAQGIAVFGFGLNAIIGETRSPNGYAIRGRAYGPGSTAGVFEGDVRVNGELDNKKNILQLDHPIDPENKILSHSSVNSPKMTNIYYGTITTGATGEGRVLLPDYFEAFNRDFHYQLTVIGDFSQAVVSKEIENNAFTIKTERPYVKVCWEVTAVRNDAYAKAYPLEVEKNKKAEEQGKYLSPEVFGKSREESIFYRPEINEEEEEDQTGE